MKYRVKPKFDQDRVHDWDDGKRADISGGELLALSAKGDVRGRKPNRLPNLVGGSWNSTSICHSYSALRSKAAQATLHTRLQRRALLRIDAREQGGLIA